MASTTMTPKTNREGLAALDEALQAGAATLQRLEEQGEQLHQTEIVADSNKYLLDRSAREIRGMTWSGWLQNQFTSGPAVPKPPPAPARAEVAPVEKRHVPIPSGGTAEQDQYVADLSTQLDDVLACGKQLNAVIDHQNAQSSRLSAKTESLWESTRRNTRAAGRVAAAGLFGAADEPKLLGHVALQCPVTKRYLRSRGTDVGLSPDLELRATCRWALYEVRPHVLSLMNSVSDKYIGMTFGGGIACNSSSFGSWQQLDMDLRQRKGDIVETPISLLAADWGGGCYVECDRDGLLRLGEQVGNPEARDRARRWRVEFLDDAYEEPQFADQVLTLKPDALERVRGAVPAVLEEAAATAYGAAARAQAWEDD